MTKKKTNCSPEQIVKKTFVIISVSARVKELNDLLESIISYEKFNDFDICIMFQDPENVSNKIKYRDRITHLFIRPELLGCHGARVYLLRDIEQFDYDVFVNLDDDMLLIEQTNYNSPIRKVTVEKDCGFVITNWGRNEKLTLAKIPRMREEYKPQILVYQGGGMVYNRNVAKIMRGLEPIKATFDTEWPLTAYLRGYKNYRYMGSLAIHMIRSGGGMSLFNSTNPETTTLKQFVMYRRSKKQRGNGRNILIPLDRDVLPAAKKLHNQNNAILLHA